MYVKNTEEFRTIPSGYKQIFANLFGNNVAKNEVIKQKNNGILTDRDLEITKFLFKFRYATLEQIYTYLKEINCLTQKTFSEGEEVRETSINSIKSRCEKLVQSRILNKFMLSETENCRFESDALFIYCLDLGGKFLLTNYSTEDTTDWYTSTNLRTSENIVNDLITTQFYIRLLETCGDKIAYFEKQPIRKADRFTIVPNFEFALKSNNELKYFIGEIVRDFNMPIQFGKTVSKLEKLLETNAWRKYCEGEVSPVLFTITENDAMANEAGKIISRSLIEKFRLSTDERIMGDLSTAFMKYIPELNKLKLVKSSIFS